jgi:hypothetical protein
MAGSPTPGPRKDSDRSNRPLVVYGGLLLAGISAVAAVVAVWPRSGSDSATSDQASSVVPSAGGAGTAPQPPADGASRSPAPSPDAVLAKGRWSASKQGFTLSVREVGTVGGAAYVELEGRNTRGETVKIPRTCLQLKDPGGRTHEVDVFADGTDWPEDVPPGDEVRGRVLFERPPETGSKAMRVDCDSIFVPSPDAADLWKGLSVTGIR